MNQFGPSTSGDIAARFVRTLAVRLASAMIGTTYTFATILFIIWVEP